MSDAFASTREQIQQVAVHVLARARFAAEGRIGLVVVPGGIGTPVFGNGVQLRIEGMSILREQRGIVDRCPITTMTACAVLGGVDLDEPFTAGHDTPPVGDDALQIDAAQAKRLFDWFAFGWSVLDETRAQDAIEPSTVQLWPEHFDAAFDTITTGDARANLGCSPGDGYSPEPYLYVGPWGPERPGDASFWNAGFGATTHTDDREEALAFFRTGLRLLRGL